MKFGSSLIIFTSLYIKFRKAQITLISFYENNLVGFKRTNEEIKFLPQYDFANEFINRLAVVIKNNKKAIH